MASKIDHPSACPSSDASMPDSSIKLPPALRRWQASEAGDSHLPPHIAEARFPALSAQLLAHAARIAAERERGEILDYACAMSAVPTVIQEIWLASGELETFALREGIQVESLAELLGEHTPPDSPATAAQSGVPARVVRPLDTFDWLHLALEHLLQIHQDKHRLHSD